MHPEQEENNGHGEFAVDTPVVKFRGKGYRLMDIVGLGALVLMTVATMMIFDHRAEAKDDTREMARSLKESNKIVADTLKETTNNTNSVIKDMATSLREMAQEQRETNCLLALPPGRRNEMSVQACRRAARGRDR